MKVKVKKRIAIIALILLVFSVFILFYSNRKKTTTLSLETTAKKFLTQDSLVYRDMDEKTITEENSQYDSLENGNIILYEYSGYTDSVIVPKELDSRKIEKIDSNAFIDNENLEMIKIPGEISKNIERIEGFEISEDLSDEEYVVYITTKRYNEEYLKYIKLTK